MLDRKGGYLLLLTTLGRSQPLLSGLPKRFVMSNLLLVRSVVLMHPRGYPEMNEEQGLVDRRP
jgi:hypothetical protein